MDHNFLLFLDCDDGMGVITRVIEVPGKRGGDRYEPAAPAELIERARRIIGMPLPSGRMSYIYKCNDDEFSHAQSAIRRIAMHQERKRIRREAQAMTLLEHVETYGMLVASRDKDGIISIAMAGNFRMDHIEGQEWSVTGTVTKDVVAGDLMHMEID